MERDNPPSTFKNDLNISVSRDENLEKFLKNKKEREAKKFEKIVDETINQIINEKPEG